jgi:putative thymidine phosphorylase
MLLKVKSLGLLAGRPVAILHTRTARRLNVHIDERVEIKSKTGRIISVVDTAKGLLKEDEVVLSEEVVRYLKLRQGEHAEISAAAEARSAPYIREKIKGLELNREKIRAIISDIVSNRLTESEIAYFVAAEYINRMSMREISYLINSIVHTGKRLGIKNGVIADKHSIGGVAGNRTTPIVVSICSAAGLIVPKTSSRAITSAAGTADVVETIARVEFSVDNIKKIVKEIGACLVWGGSLGLAPADDKIIQVERLLSLDPEAQLLASILSKKISAGSTHVIIDIPCGKSAKFTVDEGKALGKKFSILGKKFGLKIETIVTDGSQPIGNGIGPVLEMLDVISVLKQEKSRPLDLEKKSLLLAAKLLELTGKAKKGNGAKIAGRLLRDGAAWRKFKEIIKAQKGDADKKLMPAKYRQDIKAGKNGRIIEISNKKINAVARAAGCPSDEDAGLYLPMHCKSKVEKEDIILTVYSKTPEKLKYAKNLFNKLKPVVIG